MFIERNITPYLLELMGAFKIVTIAGPRQSGKTTLAKLIAEKLDLNYYTMDDEMLLQSARDDPMTFVQQLSKSPAVIDEIQMAAELIRPLKMIVDSHNRNGMFLLTGSADLFKMNNINESLAGRMVNLNLYPFSQYEISAKAGNIVDTLFDGSINDVKLAKRNNEEIVKKIVAGGFPAVIDKSERLANNWFESYIGARIEKDLGLIKRVSLENRSEIFKLLKLLAYNNAALLKYSSLSKHLAIKDMTVKSDIEILEALYLVKRVNPFFTNRGKREIKAPKLHFLDTGLASHLVGLDADTLLLRERGHLGALVENFVYTELLKHTTYAKKSCQIFHYRDGTNEVDFVLESSNSQIVGIEVKASSAVKNSQLSGLVKLAENSGSSFVHGFIFYMGEHLVPLKKDGYTFWLIPLTTLF